MDSEEDLCEADKENTKTLVEQMRKTERSRTERQLFVDDLCAAIRETTEREIEKAALLREQMMKVEELKGERQKTLETILRVVAGHDKKLLGRVHRALEGGSDIKTLDGVVDKLLEEHNPGLLQRKRGLVNALKKDPPGWIVTEYQRLGREDKLAPEERQLMDLLGEALELFGYKC